VRSPGRQAAASSPVSFATIRRLPYTSLDAGCTIAAQAREHRREPNRAPSPPA